MTLRPADVASRKAGDLNCSSLTSCWPLRRSRKLLEPISRSSRTNPFYAVCKLSFKRKESTIRPTVACIFTCHVQLLVCDGGLLYAVYSIVVMILFCLCLMHVTALLCMYYVIHIDTGRMKILRAEQSSALPLKL